MYLQIKLIEIKATMYEMRNTLYEATGRLEKKRLVNFKT